MATGHGLPISGARLGPTRRDDSGGKAAHSKAFESRVNPNTVVAAGKSDVADSCSIAKAGGGDVCRQPERWSRGASPGPVSVDGAGLSRSQVALFDSNTSQHHPHSLVELSPRSLASAGLRARVARCSRALRSQLSSPPEVVVSI